MATGDVLQYNPNRDYTKAPLLPDGEYTMVLEGAQDDWHIGPSTFMTRTVLMKTQGENGTGGRRFYVSLSLSPRAFITPMFLQACGVTAVTNTAEELMKVIDECITKRKNTQFNAVVGTQPAKDGYAEKNTIRRFEIDPAIKELWKANRNA